MSKKSIRTLSKVIGVIMIVVVIGFSLTFLSSGFWEVIDINRGFMMAFVIILIALAINLISGVLLLIQSKVPIVIARMAGIISILFALIIYIVIFIDFDLGNLVLVSIVALPLIVGGLLLLKQSKKQTVSNSEEA